MFHTGGRLGIAVSSAPPVGGAWGVGVGGAYLPDDVEDGRQDELVVDSEGHVARLVEGGGDGAHGVAQVHRPEQEQELSWRANTWWCSELHIHMHIHMPILLYVLSCRHIFLAYMCICIFVYCICI